MSSAQFQHAQRNLAYVSQSERDRFAAYVSGNSNHRNIQGAPSYGSGTSAAGGGGYYTRPAGASLSARGPAAYNGTHVNRTAKTVNAFDNMFKELDPTSRRNASLRRTFGSLFDGGGGGGGRSGVPTYYTR